MTVVISRRGIGGGVSKLSQLEIDSDKDWHAKDISNVGVLSLQKLVSVGLERDTDGLFFDSTDGRCSIGGNIRNVGIHIDDLMFDTNVMTISSRYGEGSKYRIWEGSYYFGDEIYNFGRLMIGYSGEQVRGQPPSPLVFGYDLIVSGKFDTHEALKVDEYRIVDRYWKYSGGVSHYNEEDILFDGYGYSRQFLCDTNIDYEYYDVVDGFERAEFGLYGKQLGSGATFGFGAYIDVSDFDLWFGIGDIMNRGRTEPISSSGFGFINTLIYNQPQPYPIRRASRLWQIAYDELQQYPSIIDNRKVAYDENRDYHSIISEQIEPRLIDCYYDASSDTGRSYLEFGVVDIEYRRPGAIPVGGAFIEGSVFNEDYTTGGAWRIETYIDKTSIFDSRFFLGDALFGYGLNIEVVPSSNKEYATCDFYVYGYLNIRCFEGDLDFEVTGNINMNNCAGIIPKYYEQDTEPTLPANGFAFWKNTADGTVWLIYHDGTSQKKVQLT